MVKKQILPAVMLYERKLVKLALNKKSLSESLYIGVETDIIEKLSSGAKEMYGLTNQLENQLSDYNECIDILEKAKYFKDVILSTMKELRKIADSLEPLVAKYYWPFPTYADILYSVK